MENIGGIRIKTPVLRLLMNLGCRKRYQMNAVAIYYHSEICYKNNRICSFVYINEIFKNRTEKNGKIKG